MSPIELFFLLRRHRAVLLAAVVAGVIAGWVTAPGTNDGAQQYEATHTLIVRSRDTPLNLEQAALLAITGAVPDVAAAELGVDAATIVRTVEATASGDLAALQVTGTSEDPQLAENAANAVARALVDELTGGQNRAVSGQRR